MAPAPMIRRTRWAGKETLQATFVPSTGTELKRAAGGRTFAASQRRAERKRRRLASHLGDDMLSVGKSSSKSLIGFVPAGNTLNPNSEANEYFARDPIVEKVGFDEATIIPEGQLFGAGGARGVPDFAVYSKVGGKLVFVQVMLSSPESFYGDLREKISKSMSWLGRYDSAIPLMASREKSGEAQRLEFTIFLWMQRKPSRRQIRTARRLLREGNRNPLVSLSCHVQVTRSNKVFPKLYKATEARTNKFSRAAEIEDLRPAFDAPFLQLQDIGSEWTSSTSGDDSSGSDGGDDGWKARYWMNVQQE